VVDEIDDRADPGVLQVAQYLVRLAPVERSRLRLDPVPANRIAQLADTA
jgi:hypothetical protein